MADKKYDGHMIITGFVGGKTNRSITTLIIERYADGRRPGEMKTYKASMTSSNGHILYTDVEFCNDPQYFGEGEEMDLDVIHVPLRYEYFIKTFNGGEMTIEDENERMHYTVGDLTPYDILHSRRIDESIRDVLFYLNTHGIETAGSCSGTVSDHVTRPKMMMGPYLWFVVPDNLCLCFMTSFEDDLRQMFGSDVQWEIHIDGDYGEVTLCVSNIYTNGTLDGSEALEMWERLKDFLIETFRRYRERSSNKMIIHSKRSI